MITKVAGNFEEKFLATFFVCMAIVLKDRDYYNKK